MTSNVTKFDHFVGRYFHPKDYTRAKSALENASELSILEKNVVSENARIIEEKYGKKAANAVTALGASFVSLYLLTSLDEKINDTVYSAAEYLTDKTGSPLVYDVANIALNATPYILAAVFAGSLLHTVRSYGLKWGISKERDMLFDKKD